ncbi:MAG: lysylphosphatidylglycerol synthase transmembrane domain-containing protein, partial [Candidatus Taylorbacteria bacterium]
VAIRSLRWNVIAGHPINEYRYFWKSMNLGYFANMIYPARTGEIIRMIAIHRYVGMTQGKAISSVIIDRIADISVIGVFIMILLLQNASGFSWGVGFLLFLFAFFILFVSLILFIFYGDKIQEKIFFFVRKCPEWIAKKLEIWYSQAYEGVQTLRNKYCVFIILILSFLVFLCDSLALYTLMLGFGWMLPFTAAFYLAIFLQAGSVLPSAPGYIGIYQIACVLALRIFGIDDSAAIAYSIVLQIVSLVIFLVCGGAVALRDGFRYYKFDITSQTDINK